MLDLSAAMDATTRHLAADGLAADPPIDSAHGPEQDPTRTTAQGFLVPRILACRFVACIHFSPLVNARASSPLRLRTR